jgi:D-beta-D-heptose 7-phosphate kinase/D-beta-D-heptose 1-phosphate adenosyltransferase
MKNIISLKKARALVGGFKGAKVLVVGDLIMDHFVWGSVTRVSPEAPVPVVDVSHETTMLGGSANVVNNITSLGGKCYVTGIIGKDDDGKKLLRELSGCGVKTAGVIVDPSRPTTIKTRVIAHHQQVVRFDKESKEEPNAEIISAVYDYIKKMVRYADVVIISDYAKGLVTESLVNITKDLANRAGKPLIVDPKVEHFDYYTGVDLITPNNNEAGVAAGVAIRDEASLRVAADVIKETLGCGALLITRGEHGMSLFEGTEETHIPTTAKEVFDVSGAGDTVAAVISLSLAAGASYRESAALANIAAGVVVEKLGTATISSEELLTAVARHLSAKVH